LNRAAHGHTNGRIVVIVCVVSGHEPVMASAAGKVACADLSGACNFVAATGCVCTPALYMNKL